MFTGPEGVGQAEAAEAFALACNCYEVAHRAESNSLTSTGSLWGCGRCRSCHKIRSESHPDIIRIEPIGQTLRIQQIRAMLDNVALKPYEARRRFVLIAEADRMTLSAANALLKVLEEPPAETSIIMWSHRPRDVLPTIMSRCQTIRFPPIAESLQVEMLMAAEAADLQAARWAARMSGGSYALGRDLLARGGFSQQRWIEKVLSRIDKLALRQVLALAEILAQNVPLLPMRMGQIKRHWHDRAVMRVTACANRGRALSPPPFYSGTQADIACFFAAERAEQQLQGSANRRMVLETMLLDFKQHMQTETNKAVADG